MAISNCTLPISAIFPTRGGLFYSCQSFSSTMYKSLCTREAGRMDADPARPSPYQIIMYLLAKTR